jgi:hypothetical protein
VVQSCVGYQIARYENAHVTTGSIYSFLVTCNKQNQTECNITFLFSYQSLDHNSVQRDWQNSILSSFHNWRYRWVYYYYYYCCCVNYVNHATVVKYIFVKVLFKHFTFTFLKTTRHTNKTHLTRIPFIKYIQKLSYFSMLSGIPSCPIYPTQPSQGSQ